MTGALQVPCPRRAERRRPEAGARPGAAGDRAGPGSAPPRRAKAAPHFQLGTDAELLLVAQSVSHGPTQESGSCLVPAAPALAAKQRPPTAPGSPPGLALHTVHTHTF